jgi:hypothetical protein
VPRAKGSRETAAKLAQNGSLWGDYGTHDVYELTGWDIKQQAFIDAVLAIVSSGATLLVRPGSGGRSIGIAIWEGDFRHSPKWCYGSEEVDQWAADVIERANGRAATAAD